MKRYKFVFRFGDGRTEERWADEVLAKRLRVLERHAERTGDRGPLEAEYRRLTNELHDKERAEEARRKGTKDQDTPLRRAITLAEEALGADSTDKAIRAWCAANLTDGPIHKKKRLYDIKRARQRRST